MSEIDKLRQRLKRVGKNVTQYNMTVAEAWQLCEEYDAMVAGIQKATEDLAAQVAAWKASKPIITAPTVRHMDGGSF